MQGLTRAAKKARASEGLQFTAARALASAQETTATLFPGGLPAWLLCSRLRALQHLQAGFR